MQNLLRTLVNLREDDDAGELGVRVTGDGGVEDEDSCILGGDFLGGLRKIGFSSEALGGLYVWCHPFLLPWSARLCTTPGSA